MNKHNTDEVLASDNNSLQVNINHYWIYILQNWKRKYKPVWISEYDAIIFKFLFPQNYDDYVYYRRYKMRKEKTKPLFKPISRRDYRGLFSYIFLISNSFNIIICVQDVRSHLDHLSSEIEINEDFLIYGMILIKFQSVNISQKLQKYYHKTPLINYTFHLIQKMGNSNAKDHPKWIIITKKDKKTNTFDIHGVSAPNLIELHNNKFVGIKI